MNGPVTYIWMVQIHGVKASIWMVEFCPNGQYVFVYLGASKSMAHMCPNGRSPNGRSPNGWYRDVLIDANPNCSKSLFVLPFRLDGRPLNVNTLLIWMPNNSIWTVEPLWSHHMNDDMPKLKPQESYFGQTSTVTGDSYNLILIIWLLISSGCIINRLSGLNHS